MTELSNALAVRVTSPEARERADAEFRERLADVLQRCDTAGVAERASEEQRASLGKLRGLGHLATSMKPDQITVALLTNLSQATPALRGLIAKQSIKDLDRSIDGMLLVLQPHIAVDTLGRLAEARLMASNATFGLGLQGIEAAPRHSVRIAALVLDAQKEVQPLADSRHITFSNDLKGAQQHVTCSVDYARRLFMNLIHNAVKYSHAMAPPARAWVHCASQLSRDTLSVRIESWGTAIERDELPQLFEPGVRGRHSSGGGRTGGGLGLAFARSVCNEHGWTLRVTSRPAVPHRADPLRHSFLTVVLVEIPRASITG